MQCNDALIISSNSNPENSYYQNRGEVNNSLKNTVFSNSDDFNPPYSGDSVLIETLTEDSVGEYVRVYTEGVTSPQGSWIMCAEDIAGLTPQQIQDVYSLPYLPDHVCDVTLPSGTVIRGGQAAPAFGGFSGGGIQYDLYENTSFVGSFSNFGVYK